MKIYQAGPLFTQAEIEFNLKLRDLIESTGHQVFLPQEECAGITDLNEIFSTCKKGIDECDSIVAVMDGADADSGTCWEVGYGYALKKLIITLRTDFRQSGDTGGFNAMLFFSSSKVFEKGNQIQELTDYLKTI